MDRGFIPSDRYPEEGTSMIKLQTPDFKDEAEEAKWWFDHAEDFEHHFEQAAANGTLGHGTAMRRIGLTPTNILLANKDAELAQAQAAERGLDYKVYLQTLLHEALVKAAKQP
jgi:predicted DNA binding CopG/RHH family protein